MPWWNPWRDVREARQYAEDRDALARERAAQVADCAEVLKEQTSNARRLYDDLMIMKRERDHARAELERIIRKRSDAFPAATGRARCVGAAACFPKPSIPPPTFGSPRGIN